MGDFQSGVWPVMLTPFAENGDLDLQGVDALTDWYIKTGVAGVFAVCLSGEMYHLSDEERIVLAERVVRRAGGRVPVVAAGTFGGEIETQAETVRRIAATGVDGVVVVVCQMANMIEGDAGWKNNVARLLDATDDIPLGLYECPRPYHRLLAPDLVKWLGLTGRFQFLKDTSIDESNIGAKLDACNGSPLGVYTPNEVMLLPCLKRGSDGHCGTMANFWPDLHVWLCRSFKNAPDAAARLQRFLTVIKPAALNKYIASAKSYVGMLGLPITAVCRAKTEKLQSVEVATLANLRSLVDELRGDLGIVDGAG